MTVSAEQDIETHSIELADTRPTMFWLPYLGEVPITLFALNFGIFGCAYILFGWKWALGFPAVHFLFGRLIAFDYHAITKIQRWLSVSAWTLDAHYTGGYSATPNPQITKKPRGMG